MSTADDLLRIVSHIETTEHPRIDLVADIYEALGHQVKRCLRNVDKRRARVWSYLKNGRWIALPDLLTDQKDAARFTEENGFWWIAGAGRTRPHEPLYGAQVRPAKIGADTIVGESEHPTEVAAALTAATLRAMAAKSREAN